jgi:hypothetical protein
MWGNIGHALPEEKPALTKDIENPAGPLVSLSHGRWWLRAGEAHPTRGQGNAAREGGRRSKGRAGAARIDLFSDDPDEEGFNLDAPNRKPIYAWDDRCCGICSLLPRANPHCGAGARAPIWRPQSDHPVWDVGSGRWRYHRRLDAPENTDWAC